MAKVINFSANKEKRTSKETEELLIDNTAPNFNTTSFYSTKDPWEGMSDEEVADAYMEAAIDTGMTKSDDTEEIEQYYNERYKEWMKEFGTKDSLNLIN